MDLSPWWILLHILNWLYLSLWSLDIPLLTQNRAYAEVDSMLQEIIDHTLDTFQGSIKSLKIAGNFLQILIDIHYLLYFYKISG